MRNPIIKLLLVLCFVSIYLHANESDIQQVLKNSEYIFCVEGGGSNAVLTLLDPVGKRVFISNSKSKMPAAELRGGPSNITTATNVEIANTMRDFFDGLRAEEDKTFHDIVDNSAFVGSFAGGARKERRKCGKKCTSTPWI